MAATLTVRIGGDITDLKKALEEGRVKVINTSNAMEKLADTLGGSRVKQEAEKWEGALKKLANGGDAVSAVTKLIAKDQEKLNAVMQRAIAVLGTEAPDAYRRLEAATRRVDTTVSQSGKSASLFSGFIKDAGASFAGFFTAGAALSFVHQGLSKLASVAETVVSAGFDMNSTLEKSTLQFTTLMGSASKAQAHVRDLFDIAAKTPFETGPIIEASRMLQTFGGSALNTRANIMLIGDAAAATGAPINELGFWVGRLYAAIQGGQPFGEAAMRLQELAVMTPAARAQMEAMQKAGKSADEIFAVFTKTMGTFKGAMEVQAGTWEGVTSTFNDSMKMLAGDTLRPLFEAARDAIKSFNDLYQAMGQAGLVADVQKNLDGIVGSLNALIKADIQIMTLGMDSGENWLGRWLFGEATYVMAQLQLANDILTKISGYTPPAPRLTREDTRGYASHDPAAAGQYLKTLNEAQRKAAAEAAKRQAELSGATAIAGLERLRADYQALEVAGKATAFSQEQLTKAWSGADELIRTQLSPGLQAFYLTHMRLASRQFDQLALLTEQASIGVQGLSADLSQPIELKLATNSVDAFAKALGLVHDQVNAMKASANSLGNALRDAFGSLPRLIEQALTGGSDLAGALTAMASRFGSTLFDGLFKAGGALNSVGNWVGKKLGSTLGGLVADLGGPLGSLLGPLVGWIGGLFGPGKEYKQTVASRGDFENAYGGNLALQKKVGEAFATLGRSSDQASAAMKAFWSARTQTDLERAMKSLTDAFDEAAKKTAADAEAAHRASWQGRQELAQKWNIDESKLGGDYWQSKLTEQGKDFLKDWGTLAQGGASIEGAGGVLGQFVSDALAHGSALPAAMKALIDEFTSKYGELKDAQGNPLDLSQLKFAPEEVADPIVAATEDQTEKLLRKGDETIAAIDRASRYGGFLAVDTGYTGPNDAPHYGDGAIVTRPTYALIGEKGPEAVVPLDRIGASAGIPGAGTAGEVSFTAIFNGAQPERYIRDVLMPGILAVLRKGGAPLSDWQTALQRTN